MKKKLIIILSILLIVIVITGIYQTFATNSLVANDDSVYNITLTDNSTITVPAKSSKIVYYQICNTNNGKVQYGVGYTSDTILVKGYWDSIDSYTGIIDYGENKYVKLKLINDTTSDDTVTLSTVLGYEKGGNLIPTSNVALVNKQVSEKNYLDVETSISSSTNTFLSGSVARSAITSVVFETDNIVPEGAVYPKDVSASDDGSVMMWYTTTDNSTYELHIGSENGKVSIGNAMYLFSYLENATSIDFTNADLKGLTNMLNMFFRCYKLTALDTSGFDTTNVINMAGLFRFCDKLTDVDVSHFKTSNVVNMQAMFGGCAGLTELDLSGWNTDKVTSMNNMFDGCSGLIALDVSNFNTSNLTSMFCMFYNCKSLKSLDLSNFNTSNVTNMYGMFEQCYSLTYLNLSSFTITPNVTNYTNMLRIPAQCNILVKDATHQTWVTEKFTHLTNVTYNV